MNIDLTGQTALVTGGNTGIGRDIALTLARSGAKIALTYFSNTDAATADEIRRAGGCAYAYPLDVTDSARVTAVVNDAAAALGGRIDILVNNAGGLLKRVMVADMDDGHWHKVIDVNLSSAFYCSRAVLPHMTGDGGRIVNIASMAAFNGGGGGSTAYATAKAGMIGFARGLAREVGGRGITVNTIAPGMILETPFHATFSTPDRIQAMIGSTPLGRAGIPSDVSGIVLFLVSELAAFVTGEVIIVNGGAAFA